jgi:hypothetical protein
MKMKTKGYKKGGAPMGMKTKGYAKGGATKKTKRLRLKVVRP